MAICASCAARDQRMFAELMGIKEDPVDGQGHQVVVGKFVEATLFVLKPLRCHRQAHEAESSSRVVCGSCFVPVHGNFRQ